MPRGGRPAPAWRRVVGRDTIAAAGLAAGGFVLGTPFALLTPVAFTRGVLDELREVHTVQFGNEADAPGYLFHLAYSLPEAMGWPLYLLALAGLGWALVRRGAREAILLAFAVPYLLVIVSWSSRFERYAIPLLPCLTLLAAVALVRGVAWLSDAGAARPGAVARHRAGGRRGAAPRAGARAGDRLSPATRAAGHSRARLRLDRAPGAAGGADRAGALQPDAARRPAAAPRGARKPGASPAGPSGGPAGGGHRS